MQETQNIKLVCFDMDNTLTTENSWYKLNLELGITEEEDQDLYNSYINGNLEYEAWIEKLVSLYKERGLATQEKILKVFDEIALAEGAKDLLLDLKERGYETAIITGSFDVMAKRVADSLGIKHYRANTKIIFDSEGKFENLVPAGDEIMNKPGYLKEICDELNITFDECICVGDGVGDVELFKAVSKGVALKDAPDELKQHAWKVVDSLSEVGGLL